jgi:hypothetical protein
VKDAESRVLLLAFEEALATESCVLPLPLEEALATETRVLPLPLEEALATETRELLFEKEEAFATEPRDRAAAEAVSSLDMPVLTLCDLPPPATFLTARDRVLFCLLSLSLVLSLSLLDEESDELSSTTFCNGPRKSG